MKLDVKIHDPRYGTEWKLPTYGTPDSAGLDLRAAIDEDIVLMPGEVKLIDTGLSINMMPFEMTMAATILPRSGLGHKKGLVLGNLTGLIDQDYHGHLFVSAWNRNNPALLICDDSDDEISMHRSHLQPNLNKDNIITITPGMEIAQLVLVPIIKIDGYNIVEGEFEETVRGAGGFGHTSEG